MGKRLSELVEQVIDNRGKNPKYLITGKYPVIDNFLIKNNLYPNLEEVNRYIDEETFKNFLRGYIKKNMPIMTLVGNGIGNISLAPTDQACIVQNTIGFKTTDELDELYLFYYLKFIQEDIKKLDRGSGQPSIKKTDILNLIIKYPEKNIQNKIINILYNIDRKININNQINDNLLKLLDIYYDKIFTDVICKKRADEIANITIGKTPPRINRDCFSKNNSDIKWLSISDIGKSGVYVFNTAEKLTQNAINTYNVKTIPKNTIVLSFKLTVGRVAITNEEMATNEAIAHFNLYDEKLTSYMYTYLRKYDYNKLGSTSSIATAVNSKIIKTMQIEIPNEKDLEKFNNLADELLRMIRLNEKGNLKLEQLRDTLLPKLMNGEINLDKIKI